MILWLLGLSAALASEEECREDLLLRFILPEAEASGVPRDVRLTAGYIGWGTADQVRGRLLRDGERVPSEDETWCYEHEGPHEVHCWWATRPVDVLEAESEYSVRVETLDAEGAVRQSVEHSFTTGSALALAPPEAPVFAVADAWEEETGETCDYPVARRYTLDLEAGNPEEDDLTLVHIYEVMEDGSEERVHTITTAKGPADGGSEGAPALATAAADTGEPEPHGLKQYLDASLPRTDCFVAVAENAAGEAGGRTRACYGPQDTGSTPGDSGDTAPPDSGSRDSGAPGSGSGDPDGSADTGGADAVPPTTSDAGGCGCGGATRASAVAWLLLLLMGWRRAGQRAPSPTRRATPRGMRASLLASLLLACSGGSDPGTTVGPADGDSGLGAGTGSGSDGGSDGGGSGGGSGSGGDAGGDSGGDEGGGLTEATDPGYPDWPDTIGTLTVTLRTADEGYAGTDSNTLSVCLTDSDCYRLNNADFDDFERAATDVFHFEEVGLPRSAVDQVTLTSQDGSDQYRPLCLELAFDGEPVYCRSELGIKMGNETSEEVESWTDPDGLQRSCETCWDAPLSHGPMQGTLEHHTARVWVRTHATRAVSLTAATPEEPEGVVVDWAYPLPEDDFTAVLEVTGVDPDTPLSLSVALDGEEAAALETRTRPAPGSAGPVRVAFGSCSKDEEQPIFDRILAEELDHFFFVGDNHYGNTGDLGGLWSWYRWSRDKTGRAERAALQASVPVTATWDDHDFTGNNTDATSEGRAEALRAFSDYWANPAYGDGATPGVFSSFVHGDVAFYILDDRYHRGLDDGILGDAQTAWLVDEVLSTEATFHVLVCGSQFTSDGSSDSWAAWPEAHEALLGGLQDAGVGGLVLLSGDIHRSELRLDDRGSRYAIPELTSSPLANSNSSCTWSDAGLLACYDDGDSYVVVDFDTSQADATLTARIVDAEGETLAEERWLRSELQ